MERNLWGIEEERQRVMHSLISERVIKRQGLFESLPSLSDKKKGVEQNLTMLDLEQSLISHGTVGNGTRCV